MASSRFGSVLPDILMEFGARRWVGSVLRYGGSVRVYILYIHMYSFSSSKGDSRTEWPSTEGRNNVRSLLIGGNGWKLDLSRLPHLPLFPRTSSSDGYKL